MVSYMPAWLRNCVDQVEEVVKADYWDVCLIEIENENEGW